MKNTIPVSCVQSAQCPTQNVSYIRFVLLSRPLFPELMIFRSLDSSVYLKCIRLQRSCRLVAPPICFVWCSWFCYKVNWESLEFRPVSFLKVPAIHTVLVWIRWDQEISECCLIDEISSDSEGWVVSSVRLELNSSYLFLDRFSIGWWLLFVLLTSTVCFGVNSISLCWC
jgi:hypothetical protein